MLSLPFEKFSTDHIGTDILYGWLIMSLCFGIIIGSSMLLEQIKDIYRVNQNEIEQQNNEMNMAGRLNQQNMNDVLQINNQRNNAADEAIEITFLLGLDDTMTLISHGFWAIYANAIFVFICAFIPYCLGTELLSLFNILKADKRFQHFHVQLVTTCGYIFLSFIAGFVYILSLICHLPTLRVLMRYCFAMVKVIFIAIMEMFAVPFLCGLWLDICSLNLNGSTFQERLQHFIAAPIIQIFYCWAIGIAFISSCVAIMSFMNEVLNPQIQLSTRNFNEFNPIQAFLDISFNNYMYHLMSSILGFGTTIFILVWIPIWFLKFISFLPYKISIDFALIDMGVLTHIFLLGYFHGEQISLFIFSKIFYWFEIFATLFGIEKQLLGRYTVDVDEAGNESHNEKPKFFIIRFIAFALLICVFGILLATLVLTVPVWIGRQILPIFNIADIKEGLYDLYTLSFGSFACYLMYCGINFIWQGQIRYKIKQAANWSYIFAAISFLMIPIFFDAFISLTFLMRERVHLNEMPIQFSLQNWIVGMFYTEIALAIILNGPDTVFKRSIERIHFNGIRRFNLEFTMKYVGKPIIKIIIILLAIPFAVEKTLLPNCVDNLEQQLILVKYLYPAYFFAVVAITCVVLALLKFKKIYKSVKDEKYLIGKRIINYRNNVK